jgi:hypothetical protein
MKRLFVIASVMTLAGSFCWGAPTETTPTSARTGPCKQILQACNAAGYYLGGHKKGPNKGEYLDCMDPILKGGSVPGVSVTPDEVSACNAHRARHAAQKAAGGAPTTTTPAPAPTH